MLRGGETGADRRSCRLHPLCFCEHFTAVQCEFYQSLGEQLFCFLTRITIFVSKVGGEYRSV